MIYAVMASQGHIELLKYQKLEKKIIACLARSWTSSDNMKTWGRSRNLEN